MSTPKIQPNLRNLEFPKLQNPPKTKWRDLALIVGGVALAVLGAATLFTTLPAIGGFTSAGFSALISGASPIATGGAAATLFGIGVFSRGFYQKHKSAKKALEAPQEKKAPSEDTKAPQSTDSKPVIRLTNPKLPRGTHSGFPEYLRRKEDGKRHKLLPTIQEEEEDQPLVMLPQGVSPLKEYESLCQFRQDSDPQQVPFDLTQHSSSTTYRVLTQFKNKGVVRQQGSKFLPHSPSDMQSLQRLSNSTLAATALLFPKENP